MLSKAILIFWGGILFGLKLTILAGVGKLFCPSFVTPKADSIQILLLTLVGSIAGIAIGWSLLNRWNCWKLLVWLTVLYLITAIGITLSPDLFLFLLFLGISGMSVGATSLIVPFYIAEVVPTNLSGRTYGLFLLAMVLSVLLALGLIPLHTANWRLIPGLEVVLSLIVMLFVLTLTKSPHWEKQHRRKQDETRRQKQIDALINNQI
jgi:MFS family permease